jgi:hypothetical protein
MVKLWEECRALTSFGDLKYYEMLQVFLFVQPATGISLTEASAEEGHAIQKAVVMSLRTMKI